MISARRLCRNGRRRCWAPAGRRHAGRMSPSEIITLLLVLHSSGFKHLKSFYHGFAEPLLRGSFPGMPCYEHFVALQKSVFVPLVFFLHSHLGSKTGLYYIDSTALAIIIALTGICRSGPARHDGLVLRLQAAPRLQQPP